MARIWPWLVAVLGMVLLSRARGPIVAVFGLAVLLAGVAGLVRNAGRRP